MYTQTDHKLDFPFSLLALVLAMALCLSVSLSVCLLLSQVGVLSKRMDESGWFGHGSFFPPIAHCVKRKREYLQK